MTNTSKIFVFFSTFVLAASFEVGCADESSRNASTGTSATIMTNEVGTNTTLHDADDSARNQRDRSNATLTPLDQGKSTSDRAITQQIRKAVVSGTNNYSMAAKNVKIITIDGKVTLRGPVNSDEEKSGIEAIAQSVAGAGNVDDQLEIKAK